MKKIVILAIASCLLMSSVAFAFESSKVSTDSKKSPISEMMKKKKKKAKKTTS